MSWKERVAATRLVARRHSDARAAVAWANHAAVEAALGDDTVDTGSASGNLLPDHIAVVAKAELLLAVADNSAVGGARSASVATRCWG